MGKCHRAECDVCGGVGYPAPADVVERVARAISNALPLRMQRGLAQQEQQVEDCVPIAKAALSAMGVSDEVERLRSALRKSREAIASLPDDALGMVRAHPSGDLDNGYAYPIRDELLAELDQALAHKEGNDL